MGRLTDDQIGDLWDGCGAFDDVDSGAAGVHSFARAIEAAARREAGQQIRHLRRGILRIQEIAEGAESGGTEAEDIQPAVDAVMLMRGMLLAQMDELRASVAALQRGKEDVRRVAFREAADMFGDDSEAAQLLREKADE